MAASPSRFEGEAGFTRRPPQERRPGPLCPQLPGQCACSLGVRAVRRARRGCDDLGDAPYLLVIHPPRHDAVDRRCRCGRRHSDRPGRPGPRRCRRWLGGRCRDARQPRTGHSGRGPRHHHPGEAGTDDGLGRMVPAPADGEVVYGTHPNRLNRVAGGISSHTPYHYVELRDLEPGQTYYYQARSNGKLATPTPFTLIGGNAVSTDDTGLGTTGPFSFTRRNRHAAGSCSPSRCATTCTWARPRPAWWAGSRSTSASPRSRDCRRSPTSCSNRWWRT